MCSACCYSDCQQGMLFTVVWIVYTAWTTLNMRSRCVDSVFQSVEIEMNEWTVRDRPLKRSL